jgi:hypothetical protein
MFSLFTEVYWSVSEDISKHHRRILYSDFEYISKKYYFSNMFSFTYRKLENAITHQRNMFESKNQ